MDDLKRIFTKKLPELTVYDLMVLYGLYEVVSTIFAGLFIAGVKLWG